MDAFTVAVIATVIISAICVMWWLDMRDMKRMMEDDDRMIFDLIKMLEEKGK